MVDFLKKLLKIVGVILLIILVSIGIYAGYYYIHEVRPKDKVVLTVEYMPEGTACTKKLPLMIRVANNSNRTIHKTSFDISVKRPNYSNDIAKWSYDNYSTDRIIPPDKVLTSCWSYPELKDDHKKKYKAKDLLYSIRNKSIEFGD